MAYKKENISSNKGLKGFPSSRKGKTYEEIYGEEKAKEIRLIISKKTKEGMNCPKVKRKLSEIKKRQYKEGKMKSPWNKGLNKENEKVKKSLDKMKKWKQKNVKGKTYEEIYGKEKTIKIKKLQSISNSLAKLGEKNPSWRGGISFEPYAIAFNNQLKSYVRWMDNSTCQQCGMPQSQLNYKLHIHHIDFNKKNNSINNLISLCRTCHLQTNYNRQNWITYFQNKLTGVAI